MEKVLIALGGNALLRAEDKGTYEDQIKHVKETASQFLKIIEAGYQLAITHGNGPQVGAILLQNEIAKDQIPSMPLDICGAESQGLIGYMLQREFYNVLEEVKLGISIVALLTQVLVNKNDPAFENPTKPIGPFYSEEEKIKLEKEKKWKMIYQENKGYRRVVPSPIPIDIVEGEIIKELYDNKVIVISCGGGGIPVIRRDDGSLMGVEAVIDKDNTGAVLAKKIGADTFMILTDVEKVYLNFGKKNQKELNKITVAEAKKYIEEEEFGTGSMKPKVEAACRFLEQGGKKVIITALEKSVNALRGLTGTVITL
ncbi:MAG: carbamate kinase [Chlamydiae bacterium SM23_39]|nr:MAG: carbamate kinase [Chlamydiae bacterium SM23_39]